MLVVWGGRRLAAEAAGSRHEQHDNGWAQTRLLPGLVDLFATCMLLVV